MQLSFVTPLQIVPYFGLLFTCFEMCKQVCLYRNGYIISPLSYKLTPGVDQSLGPNELEEVKRHLKNRNFGSGDSSLRNRWWCFTWKMPGLLKKRERGSERLKNDTTANPRASRSLPLSDFYILFKSILKSCLPIHDLRWLFTWHVPFRINIYFGSSLLH